MDTQLPIDTTSTPTTDQAHQKPGRGHKRSNRTNLLRTPENRTRHVYPDKTQQNNSNTNITKSSKNHKPDKTTRIHQHTTRNQKIRHSTTIEKDKPRVNSRHNNSRTIPTTARRLPILTISPKTPGLSNGINEIIAVTTNPDNTANAAPIGLHKQGNKLQIHLYKNQTRENIKHTKHLTANITHNPILIVTSALSKLDQKEYTKIEYQQEKYPILENSDAWILFKAEERDNNTTNPTPTIPTTPTIFILEPLTNAVNREKSQVINRGSNAVIEASIHATRYVLNHNQKQLNQIKYYNKIVNKCGTPQDNKAMKTLYKLCNIK